MDDLIKKLVEAYGPSGFEDQIRGLIQSDIADLVDEMWVDRVGNLIARKQGNGDGRKVVIAAHMDEIGVMVTHITEKGFLRFTNIGGVFPPTLMGARVQFADGRRGTVHPEPGAGWGTLQSMDKHFIDVGASSRDDCPVAVGAAAGFWRALQVDGERLTSKTMDDRIGCVVMIETLRRFTSSPHDLYFVFAVQEEVGTRGAQVAAQALDPDVAIAVDITPAFDLPGREFSPIGLGKGPAIKVKDSGMIAHAGLVRLMRARAEAAGIPYQLEVLERGSTDARAMQVANAGAAAGCISIPTRYAHTQSETVDRRDVEASIQLLLALIEGGLDV